MNQPLIQLENIDVALQAQPVLHDIWWQLHTGEHWAILGGNGAGKSTLLRLLRGEIWPVAGKGQRLYRFDGVETFSPLRARENIAFVTAAQHEKYRRQEWDLVGREVLLSGCFGTELIHQKVTARHESYADQLARELRIEELMPRDINTLSHGELRKLLIARALMARPQVLVLDEFCTGLDTPSRHMILDFINELAARDIQLITSTHRRDEIVPSITHVALMGAGRIVAQGHKDEVLAGHQPPPAISHTPPAKASSRFETLVQLKNVDLYREGNPVLQGLNWTWHSGEHWRVMGRNGSGKTTFLKLLAGELWPAYGGEIERFDNYPFHDIWEMKARIGVVSPELQERYVDEVDGNTVIASGFFSSIGVAGELSDEQKTALEATIQSCGVAHLRLKSITQMSSGEARKLLIARAIVHRPDLLLLDEPFDSLDEGARADIAQLLCKIAAEGTHLLLISHHDEDALPVLTHEMHLQGGRIAWINCLINHQDTKN